MSGNDEISSIYFGDNLQSTNCILDSGATCHMTTQVSDFVLVSLENINKYIEVTDGNYVTEKKKYKFK